MRISIALCTYNGTRHLNEQLSSIAAQTRLPDEIVICDDCSGDGTWEMLEAFSQKIACPVIFYRNQNRLGSTKNFEKTIGLCSGDLIALCDQDDVWFPHKLEIVERKFLESPDLDAVFSDGEIVGENLSPLGYTLWQHTGFHPGKQKKMEYGYSLKVLLKHVVVTGATLVFRSSLKEYILPIPSGWVHDAWIALLASTRKNLGIVSIPLILYRQHGENQIGARYRGLAERFNESLHINRRDYYAGELSRYEEALKRASSGINPVSAEALQLLEAKQLHLKKRAGLPASRLLRIIPILIELLSLRYHRFSFSWQVAVKDLLLPS
ncbi:MAG: glycosyltransferase family 2 protein [Proteobacteria bacterium]|nr:glycosyltransferase family 2 protein [Pseudomonadota bacterium]MBU1713128.1 glycosyltransferase family 2 protein [Pseudomonadota bacterium]